MSVESILLFGDSWGMPDLIEAVPRSFICGIVAAEIRPHSHQSLKDIAGAVDSSFIIQPRAQSDNYPAFIERVRLVSPDLILVNSYSMLLRPELLTIPRYGAINVHAALLPEYRGSNPLQWALINNEQETGTTMHYMDESFDKGDIIAQKRVPIFLEDTWVGIHARLGEANRTILREQMPNIIGLTNARTPQDESRAKYYRRRTPEDGRIDWNEPAINIYNLIRALVRPHPGAFYYEGGRKIVLDGPRTLQQVTEIRDRILRAERVGPSVCQ